MFQQKQLIQSIIKSLIQHYIYSKKRKETANAPLILKTMIRFDKFASTLQWTQNWQLQYYRTQIWIMTGNGYFEIGNFYKANEYY